MNDGMGVLRHMKRLSRGKAGIVFILAVFMLLILYFRFRRHSHFLSRDAVMIFVFEEHHEALPYWLEAADNGVVQKSGNTLLHIDGHSDDAPPVYVEGFPWYRWPRSNTEIRAMMQSNDAFILPAIMTGMIDRMIWVWPEWDQSNHESDIDIKHVEYGEVNILGPEGSETAFCMCEKKTSGNGEVNCYFRNETAVALDTSDKDAFLLRGYQCQIKGSFTQEEIREDLALGKMKSGKWLTSEESVILDIDEDYFGCVSGGQVLFDAGVKHGTLNGINNFLELLFCPKSTFHEHITDRTLVSIVKEAIKLCSPSAKTCSGHDKAISMKAETDLVLLGSQYSRLLCQMDSSDEQSNRIRDFVVAILKLNQRQLKALAQTGFCLMTTPKSFEFYHNNGAGQIKVCHGFNLPNESAVIFHNPTEDETEFRKQRLKQLLTDPHAPVPKVVTVCRSMRDGYTPRKFFSSIESSLLKMLMNIKNKKFMVHYDQDLLGGKEGWPDKHNL